MPSAARDRASTEAGFTLIEVLVALAVTASVLIAIIGTALANARAARTLEARAALIDVARAVEAGIPPRESLTAGEISGEIAGHRWRMVVRPMPAAPPEGGEEQRPAAPAPWVPLTVAIRVRAPSGAMLDVDTIRLARAGGSTRP